jgi:hypothetical protein
MGVWDLRKQIIHMTIDLFTIHMVFFLVGIKSTPRFSVMGLLLTAPSSSSLLSSEEVSFSLSSCFRLPTNLSALSFLCSSKPVVNLPYKISLPLSVCNMITIANSLPTHSLEDNRVSRLKPQGKFTLGQDQLPKHLFALLPSNLLT